MPTSTNPAAILDSPRVASPKIINILPADGWLVIYPSRNLPVNTRRVSFFALVEAPDGQRTTMPVKYRGGKLDLIDPLSVAAVVHQDDWQRFWSRISQHAIEMWQRQQKAEAGRG